MRAAPGPPGGNPGLLLSARYIYTQGHLHSLPGARFALAFSPSLELYPKAVCVRRGYASAPGAGRLKHKKKRTLSSTAVPRLSTPIASEMQVAADVQSGAKQPACPKRRVTVVESQGPAARQTTVEGYRQRESLSAQLQRDVTVAQRRPSLPSIIVSLGKGPVRSPAAAAPLSARGNRAADSRRSQTPALPDAVGKAPPSARISSAAGDGRLQPNPTFDIDRPAPLSACYSIAGSGGRPPIKPPAILARPARASARASLIAGGCASQTETLSNTIRLAPLSARGSVFGGGRRQPQAEALHNPASLAPLSARISAILGPAPLGARGSVTGGGRRSHFAPYNARPVRLSPRASTVLAAAAAAAAPLTSRRSRVPAVSPACLATRPRDLSKGWVQALRRLHGCQLSAHAQQASRV